MVCTGGYVQSGDTITIGAQLPTYDCYILDPETMEADDKKLRLMIEILHDFVYQHVPKPKGLWYSIVYTVSCRSYIINIGKLVSKI